MDRLAIILLAGISYGMILFLIAAGFSLIFGTMGILNLAHGSLYILGAYFGLTVVELGSNFWLAALAGGMGVVLVGLVLERAFLSRLYKQINEQVLLTLGFVYIFGNSILWVWGPRSRIGTPPSFAAGVISIGDISFPIYRILIILIGLAAAIGLWWFQEKTRGGTIVRAGMDDKEMTVGLGINYRLICSAIFLLGAFMAGVAGFIGAPVIGVHSGMAFDILLLALIVIVVGGVGYVQGALLGALIIGLIDAFGKAFFPDLAMFSIYLAMIVMLLVKPTGLLGRKQV